MKRIAIVTNVMPLYREAFYSKLFSLSNFKTTVFCQESIKGQNLELCHKQLYSNVNIVKSLGLSREKLVWQFLPIFSLIREFDYIVILGNPRIISNVFWSILFRLSGKEVAIWGQAHTANANYISEVIRLFWWRNFNNILVYTDKEVAYLRDRNFTSRNILSMNNGLDQEAIESEKKNWPSHILTKWQHSENVYGKIILLSCARLEEKNEFEFIIKILPRLIRMYPSLVWCVIGEGIQRDYLRKLANEHGVDKSIFWLGKIYEESCLAPWFLSATLMVHPGAIGLSLLHSFGYGLPVVTHDQASAHMPEFSAIEDNVNSLTYIKGSLESSVSAIQKLIDDKAFRMSLSKAAANTARKKYNTTVMSNRFEQFINNS